MATQFEIDCALMSGAAYISTRAEPNRFPIPNGWQKYSDWPADSVTGFEAITFTNGTEIVISFAGTYPKNPDGSTAPLPLDLQADANLATGYGSDQLLQACEYYLDVKRQKTSGTEPN